MTISGKVHCFFEQSGTFKNEFIKLGIPAEDYDFIAKFIEKLALNTDRIISRPSTWPWHYLKNKRNNEKIFKTHSAVFGTWCC